MRDEREHIPDQIARLEDSESLVARAAHAALKSLSGEDFGPKAGTSKEERARTVQDWKKWWSNQPAKGR